MNKEMHEDMKAESKPGISDAALSQLSEWVAGAIGLHFPRNRWNDLERGIGQASREFGFKDTESCLGWLLSSPVSKKQIEILASYLTIGETYFFREKESFEVLERHILPELIVSRRKAERRLRIWSAACATGEEPYSIAILLRKMLPDWKNWNITILATDINPRFLKKAAEGVYGEWSFRGTPQWVKEGYFTRKDSGHYEIHPQIKEMVNFSYLNLAEDVYPSLMNNTNAMDIVFCRNVLMYFVPGQAGNVIQNLHRSLMEGGWLFVSPGESSPALHSLFAIERFEGTFLYRKDAGKSRNIMDALSSEIAYSRFPEEIGVPIQDHSPPLPVHFESFPMPEMDLASEPPESLLSKKEMPEAAEPSLSLYQEASALYEQGFYEEVIEKLIQEDSTGNGGSRAIMLLARAYANQGRLSDALAWCEKAVAGEKLNPGCHYLLATILQEKGRMEEAAQSLRRALYLEPDFVLAHYALGALTGNRGKIRESARHFKNTLSLLDSYNAQQILPESDGMSAGRLKEIIQSTAFTEKPV